MPPASATTSLIRSPVPSSMPLARLTTTASAGIDQASKLDRRVWDGTASTTKDAPAIASCGSVTARSAGGKGIVGK